MGNQESLSTITPKFIGIKRACTIETEDKYLQGKELTVDEYRLAETHSKVCDVYYGAIIIRNIDKSRIHLVK